MVETRKQHCTAKSKRSGMDCRRWAVKGWNVCQVHGAGGGRPIERGIYANAFRAQASATYEALRKNPKLFDLVETTAALDTIIESIGIRLAEGDTPEFRTRAVAMVDAMIAARGQPDGEAGKKFQELVDHLRKGDEESKGESILFERLERIAKRKEEANKILHAKQNSIPTPMLQNLLTALIAALHAHVDETKARAVMADVSRAWGDPANRVDGLVNPN